MSKNNPDCPCTWPGCPRHGDCQACKAYHHARGEKTSCEKKPNVFLVEPAVGVEPTTC